MLVLTRKIGERIIIDENIAVTLVDIRNGKARIGIEAPREVPVHRSEVHAAIHAADKPIQSEQPKPSQVNLTRPA